MVWRWTNWWQHHEAEGDTGAESGVAHKDHVEWAACGTPGCAHGLFPKCTVVVIMLVWLICEGRVLDWALQLRSRPMSGGGRGCGEEWKKGGWVRGHNGNTHWQLKEFKSHSVLNSRYMERLVWSLSNTNEWIVGNSEQMRSSVFFYMSVQNKTKRNQIYDKEVWTNQTFQKNYTQWLTDATQQFSFDTDSCTARWRYNRQRW